MKLLVRFLWVMAVLATAVAATMYWEPLWVADQGLHFHLWQAGVQTKFVSLPEGRVRFFEMEPQGGGGTPLVLVHGLGGRAEDFASLMPKMAAQGFHVYALDLLGYGQADRPANSDYSIQTEEGVLLHFLDAEHLEKPDVAGWSMGGWVVLRLALDAPQRVNRLAVMDSAGIFFHTTVDVNLFAPKDEAGVAKLMRMMSPTMKVPPPFVARAIVRRNGGRKWVAERSLTAMRTGRGMVDAELPTMQTPLLIVWGSDDLIIPLSVGQKMHAMNPQSVMATVQGCGHFAPVECSGRVSRAMGDFLKSEPVAQGGGVVLR